jgi:predicted secreted protein
MLELDEHSNGQIVDLKIGQTMAIGLSETPSTGFQWTLASNGEPACTLVSDSFEPGIERPGQAGLHRWHFQATHAVAGVVELQYRQPWDKSTAPSRTFTLAVRVHP